MTTVSRLVTFADIADRSSQSDEVAVSLRHEAELTDGRRVLLLDDRGWGSTQSWAATSVEEVQETARMVVGPDEPPEGRSQEDMETVHWASLQQIAQQRGVAIDAAELRQLPHDIVLSERLLERIGTGLDGGTPG